MISSKTRLQPLGKLCIIEFNPRQERKTESGIIATAPKFEGMPTRGKVLRTGPKVTEVKEGDYVFYEELKPIGARWGDKKIMFVHEDKIQAVKNG